MVCDISKLTVAMAEVPPSSAVLRTSTTRNISTGMRAVTLLVFTAAQISGSVAASSAR